MAEKSQSFRDVLVWQKAHALTLKVYDATAKFPRDEVYGLCSQLRRCSSSIGSNFVEGFRKRTKPDKILFYNTAQGSADECLYQLILAQDLKCADTTALQGDAEEVSRPLQGYINGLERDGS